jgi:hypothetical protein
MRKKMQPQHAVEALSDQLYKGDKVWKGQQFLVNWLERRKMEELGLVKRLE